MARGPVASAKQYTSEQWGPIWASQRCLTQEKSSSDGILRRITSGEHSGDLYWHA